MPANHLYAGTEFSLEGKVALVTGACGLIGYEVCHAYLSAGAQLIFTDLGSIPSFKEKFLRLESEFGKEALVSCACDVSDPSSVQSLFNWAEASFKRLDILVNLAAIDSKFDANETEKTQIRFENFPLAAWEKSFSVNCKGLFLVTQLAIKKMLLQQGGNIINVASTYSLVSPNKNLYRSPSAPTPKFKPIDYVATKSMVPNFTRYLATHYGENGIRANTIVPHGIDNNHPAEFRENFSKLSPLGRLCDRKELRGPFIFLASDASSYMTGSTLVVDGGWTAW